MDRRQLLGWAAALGATVPTVGLAGCGAGGDGTLVRADLARAALDPRQAPAAASSASAFGVDLVSAVLDQDNLICSPLSVLVALAMARNGAAGRTAAEMDRALHLPTLDALNAGLNAVDQTLATRTGKRGSGARKGKVEIDLANAVWGQRGLRWQQPFLDTLSTDYGTGVRATDFQHDPAGARRTVNGWVADRTHDKITDIATPAVINEDTRLALVNALYLKAPWQTAFSPAGDHPFSTPSGGKLLPMIISDVPASWSAGRGWTGARIPLLGGELAVTVVRPDHDVRRLLTALDGGGLDRLLRQAPQGSTQVTMPTFGFRSTFDLKQALVDLGMVTAFSDAADFSGLTADAILKLQAVAHQGFVALDEEGVEAAAATVVTAMDTAGSAPPPHELVLDRPFVCCIHDIELALPLLIGVVNDPSAS